MDIHLIWAQDNNGGIGINGKLPWHIKEDLQHFKKLTMNSTIIMGRKTWESLPKKPLPNRTNVVLSHSKQKKVITFCSYKECINELKKNNLDKVFIIGGRSMYEIFFNDAIYLHITHVKLLIENINEFFPVPKSKIKKKFNKILESNLSKSAVYSLWKKR